MPADSAESEFDFDKFDDEAARCGEVAERLVGMPTTEALELAEREGVRLESVHGSASTAEYILGRIRVSIVDHTVIRANAG